MQETETDLYIREGECARLSGLSRTTRWRLERIGRFPERRQLGDNSIGWLLSEILEWQKNRPARKAGTHAPFPREEAAA
jgi:prophage regulatory protein